jgi:DNA-binding MarR family transcriptional regulator
MEKRNLIYRETSKNDRRSFNIFLEENGKEIKNELTSIALEIQNKLFKGISRDEAKVLEGVLSVINSNLSSYNK